MPLPNKQNRDSFLLLFLLSASKLCWGLAVVDMQPLHAVGTRRAAGSCRVKACTLLWSWSLYLWAEIKTSACTGGTQGQVQLECDHSHLLDRLSTKCTVCQISTAASSPMKIRGFCRRGCCQWLLASSPLETDHRLSSMGLTQMQKALSECLKQVCLSLSQMLI